MKNELNRNQKDALVTLMAHKGKLKRQEYKTLKGLIYSGDVEGALKGLEKIVKRKNEREKVMETLCIVYKIHPKNKKHPITAHTANQRMIEEWRPIIGKTVFLAKEEAEEVLRKEKSNEEI